MAALVCRSPPLSYILFPCSGLCWHALPFSILVDTIGTTWNHVELLGFSWMCMAALVCRSPPFHTFYLELPGTYTTLGFSWMCPAPWRSSTESKSSSWGIVATVRNGTQEAGPRRGSARLPRLPRLGGTQIPAAPSTCVSSRGAVG